MHSRRDSPHHDDPSIAEPPRASGGDWVIRQAREGDETGLADLLEELGFPDTAAAIRTRLASMVRGGELVLVVAKRARGRGIGRALVEAAERHLAMAGCALVEVTSHQRLIDAHAFYRKLGYEVTSFRFKKDLDAVELRP